MNATHRHDAENLRVCDHGADAEPKRIRVENEHHNRDPEDEEVFALVVEVYKWQCYAAEHQGEERHLWKLNNETRREVREHAIQPCESNRERGWRGGEKQQQREE